MQPFFMALCDARRLILRSVAQQLSKNIFSIHSILVVKTADILIEYYGPACRFLIARRNKRCMKRLLKSTS